MNYNFIIITQLAYDYCIWFSLFGRCHSKSPHPWLYFTSHRLKWTEPVSQEFLLWSGTWYCKGLGLLSTWVWGMLLLLPCSGFAVLIVGLGTTLPLWRVLFVVPITEYFQMMIDSYCASAVAVFKFPHHSSHSRSLLLLTAEGDFMWTKLAGCFTYLTLGSDIPKCLFHILI